METVNAEAKILMLQFMLQSAHEREGIEHSLRVGYEEEAKRLREEVHQLRLERVQAANRVAELLFGGEV